MCLLRFYAQHDNEWGPEILFWQGLAQTSSDRTWAVLRWIRPYDFHGVFSQTGDHLDSKSYEIPEWTTNIHFVLLPHPMRSRCLKHRIGWKQSKTLPTMLPLISERKKLASMWSTTAPPIFGCLKMYLQRNRWWWPLNPRDIHWLDYFWVLVLQGTYYFLKHFLNIWILARRISLPIKKLPHLYSLVETVFFVDRV